MGITRSLVGLLAVLLLLNKLCVLVLLGLELVGFCQDLPPDIFKECQGGKLCSQSDLGALGKVPGLLGHLGHP